MVSETNKNEGFPDGPNRLFLLAFIFSGIDFGKNLEPYPCSNVEP